MASVEAAINRMTTASTRCRAIRSPSGPNTNPPSGRMKNAAAKIAKVFSRGFISRRKETGGDERCEEAVDGKVEPLDGVADRSSGHSLTHIRCPAAALAPAGWHGDSPESK